MAVTTRGCFGPLQTNFSRTSWRSPLCSESAPLHGVPRINWTWNAVDDVRATPRRLASQFHRVFLVGESVFPRFTVVCNARDQVGERAGGLGARARRDEWLGERTSGLACWQGHRASVPSDRNDWYSAVAWFTSGSLTLLVFSAQRRAEHDTNIIYMAAMLGHANTGCINPTYVEPSEQRTRWRNSKCMFPQYILQASAACVIWSFCTVLIAASSTAS